MAKVIIVTGLPGSGKSSVANVLAWRHKTRRIQRIITRKLRMMERDGNEDPLAENKRVSDEVFHAMVKAGKIFHPTSSTHTEDGSKTFRGFPHISEWPLDDPDAEIILVVAGPRAAREMRELIPNSICVFLTAKDSTLVQRIADRYNGGEDYVRAHIDKINEYRMLDIEQDFEHVIDTDEVDDPQHVALRIEVLAGFTPTELKRD